MLIGWYLVGKICLFFMLEGTAVSQTKYKALGCTRFIEQLGGEVVKTPVTDVQYFP